MIRAFQKLIERQLLKANAEGKLSGLEGEGKPLPDRSSEALVDPAIATGMRIMAQAGVTPPEFPLKQQLDEARAAWREMTDPEEKKKAMARIADLEMRGRLRSKLVDIADTDAVVAACDEDVALVWVESPTNPNLDVADIERICTAAHEAGAYVVVDNTFATPLLQRPLDLGADLVVHSATKYLAGHSDALLGALVTRDDQLFTVLKQRTRELNSDHDAVVVELSLPEETVGEPVVSFSAGTTVNDPASVSQRGRSTVIRSIKSVIKAVPAGEELRVRTSSLDVRRVAAKLLAAARRGVTVNVVTGTTESTTPERWLTKQFSEIPGSYVRHRPAAFEPGTTSSVLLASRAGITPWTSLALDRGLSRTMVSQRTVLRLDPRLAPVKVAVLPLSRNADLSPKARDLAAELRKHWYVDFDDAGAIGKRYRRQDEIGTPYCVTVDFDTLEDGAVTVRERDTMQQERIAIDGISGYFAQRFLGA